MKGLSAKRIQVSLGDIWKSPNLHVLLTQEEEIVVARCLDFTVSSHGENEKEAIQSLGEAIKEYLLTAIYGITYVTGKGRHPKVFDPQTKRSYPVTAHGKKTMILSYALNDIIDKFDLPADIFDKE